MSDPVAILRRVSRLAGTHVEFVSQMNSISNSAWRIQFANEPAVLRQHTLSFGPPVTDHERELRIHALVAEHGLAPDILFADAASGVLITRFESAGAFSRDAIDAQTIPEIAASLRALHSIAVPEGLEGYSLSAAADRYWHRAGAPQDAELLACVSLVHENEALSEAEAPVLCHRDVLHSNLLASNPVQFIDFEFASPGERWFDLAAFARWHQFDAVLTNTLLEVYLQAQPSERERASFDRACRSFDALCTLWSLPAIT
ncbi:MAG: phosphotransferase [Pseudomonadota bacterium]